MPVLPLTYHPNSLLRATLTRVDLNELRTVKIQKLIDDMTETMFAKNGIGIAANQVGKNLSLAILSTDEGPQPVINPRITYRSFRKENDEEGCLSIPGVFGLVKRHLSITMEAFDRHGKPVTIKAKGLLARLIQHELDHLNGYLCIDRMTKVTKGNMPDGKKNV
ncbi:MAG: peptide deformylase [Patescibacteria group bacterium]|jgi:peptide deformylase